jgi:putative addiction module killer protein
MIKVREYLDTKGNSPYAKWFARLNANAAAKVATAVYRMEQGNFSNVKGIGAGVYEYRIDFGPGYRIYFWQGRRPVGDIACWWYEETPEFGYHRRERVLARLQTAETP